MKAIISLFALLLLTAAPALAADRQYEVYYFFASWRCTNCTNAEAWAGEAVKMLQQANPSVKIVFAPKQLGKNKALVAQTKAKRVDLVVAEVENGKIIRFENLGNLLNVVGSKPLLMKTSLDGILAFDAKGGRRLKQPDALAELGRKAAQPPTKIGVFIIMDNPDANSNPKVADIISHVLSSEFAEQVQQQAVTASIIDANNPQNKGWLDMFNAHSGDVVVALIRGNSVENFDTIGWPRNAQEEQGFMASFSSAMKQSMGVGDL